MSLFYKPAFSMKSVVAGALLLSGVSGALSAHEDYEAIVFEHTEPPDRNTASA